MSIQPFSDEQLRAIINLDTAYQAWIEYERELSGMPYSLSIKQMNGTQYVIEKMDRDGRNSKSHGRADEGLIQWVEETRRSKADIKDRLAGANEIITEYCRVCRALRLPLLSSEAGDILRHADRRGLLDGTIMIVGTNAVPAYAIEANAFIHDAPQETRDFDLAWVKPEAEENLQPIWDLLKAVDGTYTVNTERPFQALNRKHYEVEVLASPSRVATMNRRDRPTPIPLPEQEWLLMGKPVSQIVACRDNKPARLVVPDPRFFALHKLWMSDQEKRNLQKRPKDLKQGNALLDAVKGHMPHYRLDDAFASSLPDELKPYFEKWQATSG